MYIYLLTNKTNGKYYVGQTIREPVERMKEHVRHSRSEKYQTRLLSRAIVKHGWGAFEMSVLETCHSQELLNFAEQKWITHYSSMGPLGYNLDSGGRSGGVRSEQVRKQHSLAMTGKVPTAETRAKIGLAATGRVASEATKFKMSETRRGKLRSQATRDLIGAAHKGKVLSDETKAAISAAAKLRPPVSDETKAKISAAGMGRKHSLETQAKMLAIRTGRIMSQATKDKIAASLKARSAPKVFLLDLPIPQE